MTGMVNKNFGRHAGERIQPSEGEGQRGVGSTRRPLDSLPYKAWVRTWCCNRVISGEEAQTHWCAYGGSL